MSELLEKLNQFTRREHTEDEVYIFDMVLCDNNVDRDGECFSLKALNKLKDLFIGKTGIFDHDAKGSSQTARIFSTEIVEDVLKKTESGENYTALKASAYMVRTDANANLIREIEAGIKKEVSISCTCKKQICSICGADRNQSPCVHVKGRSYNDKQCYVILDDVSDAYEWSFVAVPAQVNAGVTKHMKGYGDDKAYEFEQVSLLLKKANDDIELLKKSVKADIIRLNFLGGEDKFSTVLEKSVEKMDVAELTQLKEMLQKQYKGEFKPQLIPDVDNSFDSFKIGKGE